MSTRTVLKNSKQLEPGAVGNTVLKDGFQLCRQITQTKTTQSEPIRTHDFPPSAGKRDKYIINWFYFHL